MNDNDPRTAPLLSAATTPNEPTPGRFTEFEEHVEVIGHFIGPAVGLLTMNAHRALAQLSETISNQRALISDYERQLSDQDAQLATLRHVDLQAGG